MSLIDVPQQAPDFRSRAGWLLNVAAALTAFVASCSTAMLATWLPAAPALPDRAGLEGIVAAAGLPVDGVQDVQRADYLFGSRWTDVPAWIGTDDYSAGRVTVRVRTDNQDATSISTSLQQQGWREPGQGDRRPYGAIVLGNDDADLVLRASVPPEIATLQVFRQTPAATWAFGILVGALVAAVVVRLSYRLHQQQPRGE